MSDHIRFIRAGAGSGKTYRITQELQDMLASGRVRPAGVIATTFTRAAANELRERVRQRLLEDGHTQLAAQMGQALINTVNGVCGEMLLRFSFEAGLSPEQKVLEEAQGRQLFRVALEGVLAVRSEEIPQLNELAHRLSKLDENYQPDWHSEIMAIAEKARSNNMRPEQLRQAGRDNGEEMLGFFEPSFGPERSLTEELVRAIRSAEENIDASEDTTKATANYLRFLRDVRSPLSQGRLPWSDWVKLSKSSPGAKSRGAAEQVRIVAGDYERHPQLHKDIREFCSNVFDIAGDSLAAFQDLKADQGLLDFVDQERLLYELLDDLHVQETLRDELQVLFVDEFQDTSPIQLALFMRLAALADQVVWVGDIKQAIYGFRGSDPELMQSVLDGVVEGGGSSDVLRYSWRSRPALVEYANAVFVPTFSESLGAEEVALEARRPERSEDAAVACWRLGSRNWQKRGTDIAYGIQQLIESGYQVVDKKTDHLRLLEFGDIAVLCRTNDRLRAISGALADSGIPVAFKRPGLMQTPEGALSMACLRRLADPRDTLASAEIRVLVNSESPEDWLRERMRFLAGSHKPYEWGEVGDNAFPQLQSLAVARKELSMLTPKEALEQALLKGGVREAVIAWGPTEDHTRHRLRNVDLLLELAGQYEDHCRLLNVAATVPGLILQFNELAQRDEDWQAEAGDGRAITLLTHHGAKGLEWPVVIAVDLDAPVKPRVWDLTVLQREDGFDSSAPLEGRRLRYWPWPFGKQQSQIPIVDQVMNSRHGEAATDLATEEIRRLLYVSITRARDLLILAVPSAFTAGGWLGTLGADWVLPNDKDLTLPNGRIVPTACVDLTAPDGWCIQRMLQEARWVRPATPADGRLERNLSPSHAPAIEGCGVGEITDIGERLRIEGVNDMTALGQAIHAVIGAEINAPTENSADRVAGVLEAWGIVSAIDPAVVLDRARGFIAWAQKTFKPIAWHVEYPVTHVLESGQVVRGFVDLLLETEEGWVIVDHKASPRPRGEWPAIAARYSGQLAMYEAAIEECSGKNVVKRLIYFAVGGGVAAVGV